MENKTAVDRIIRRIKPILDERARQTARITAEAILLVEEGLELNRMETLPDDERTGPKEK